MDQHSSSDPSSCGNDLLRTSAVSAFLILVVACVFGQTVAFEFVNLDDNVGVYENPWVKQGLTAASLRWAFTSHVVGNWDPLTWISHTVDWQIYGENAGGHHLTNVLLHAVNTVLLFLVLLKMTAGFWPSALAAALWAIHPLRAESVAWVTERKDVLSGLFFMLTLWAYASYVRRQPWSVRGILLYLATMAFYALGLLSKPMLVTLPCLLLLLDYWPLKRMGWPWSVLGVVRRILEKLPLLVLAGASCAVTVWAQRVVEYSSRGVWWRIGNALLSYVGYLRQFFWPTDLALLYPCRGPDMPVWPVLGAAFLLLAVTVLAVAWMRKHPYLLIGWLWYLGMMLPVVGFVSFGNEAPADRFTYLPQIGLCVAVAWGMADWCRSLPWRRWVCGVASASALAVLMGCAWQQTTYWRDSETLWNRTLKCTSDNYHAYTLLGGALADRSKTSDAIVQFKKALAIKPDYSQANYALGVAEASLGRPDAAIACYRKAIIDDNPERNPHYASAQNNLGYALLIRGSSFEALEHFSAALKVKPDFAEAHYNSGLALHTLRRFRGAIAEYQEAIKARPDYAEAYFNLGMAFDACGERADARFSNGRVLHILGNLSSAIGEYEEAIRLKPGLAEAHYYLALALDASGRRADAIEHCREAIRIEPDFEEAQSALDRLLDASGNP